MAVEFLPSINRVDFSTLAAEINKAREPALDTVQALKLKGIRGREGSKRHKWIIEQKDEKHIQQKPTSERVSGKGNLLDIMA